MNPNLQSFFLGETPTFSRSSPPFSEKAKMSYTVYRYEQYINQLAVNPNSEKRISAVLTNSLEELPTFGRRFYTSPGKTRIEMSIYAYQQGSPRLVILFSKPFILS